MEGERVKLPPKIIPTDLTPFRVAEDREVPIHILGRHCLFPRTFSRCVSLRFFDRAGRKPEKFLGPSVCPSEPTKSRSFDPRDLKLTRTPLSKCVSPPCTNCATNFQPRFVAIFVKFTRISIFFSRLRFFLFKKMLNDFEYFRDLLLIRASFFSNVCVCKERNKILYILYMYIYIFIEEEVEEQRDRRRL